ncbi:serine palmitoyl transferase subunit [Plasmopara halstedii]|uniref:serine C-palmitoyltransferase n=1 Tax=Plasmopara halstedii TaxID=4781 RepID=A0A0P1B0J6_PLAHL|nr:serine palmitoyl transferase subunit [Plasmopara halstedii]CEG47422.1 serine palmitoyl transferase subunit [Plasmopara halstedii]|eukprot:XP_024583791.1 serine palmitoyl transferase subunit [Plasmopara halstedii]
MSEWWATIGQPFAEALLSLDFVRIKAAFANAPRSYYDYIRSIYERSPEHVIIETFLIVFVIYITFVKRDKPKGTASKLSEHPTKTMPLGIVEATPDTHIKLQGFAKSAINLATFDFLGIGSRPELKEVAIKTLTKYGCGSCGPRGFYGTIDTHEILEKDIAQMMGTTDSITFSDTEATSSSVLPAFAKRGDLIVMDDGCNDSILVGANLARCSVLYYKHNDVEDLECVLKNVRDEDKTKNRGSDCQRRYVVTEALFRNHGDMVDLPKVVKLCDKYFFRLFLDESFSFGVLGKSGRGLTEHYGMDVSEVAIICSSLAGSTASVGGFSTGSQEVVDYQRINTAGYVFSASAPPFTSACCSEAIRIMKNEPELFIKLRDNAKLAHDILSAGVQGVYSISKAVVSPILHLRLLPEVVACVGSVDDQRNLQREVCDTVMQKCLAKGVAICSPRYKAHQTLEPRPSLRVSVTAIHSIQDIKTACTIIVTEAMATAKELRATYPKDAIPQNGLRLRN